MKGKKGRTTQPDNAKPQVQMSTNAKGHDMGDSERGESNMTGAGVPSKDFKTLALVAKIAGQ